MKKLLLLFGLLILLIFSSEAQQYGKYPYKFDFYGPMQWNQTNDSIHISVLGCLFEPLHMIFSKSSDFEVLRRQSFSNNLWQNAQCPLLLPACFLTQNYTIYCVYQ